MDLIIKLLWWIAIPGAFCLGCVVSALLIAGKDLECVTCLDRKREILREYLRQLEDDE